MSTWQILKQVLTVNKVKENLFLKAVNDEAQIHV